ncbi:speckle-type POZ protein B [Caerostris extrusa]|uniref:Speckle-type POZ protein B n=1 Tax=Caerostris extrusa TaxID=172846 RepID=A0AAV4PVK5_CAEEX|nr:speckle-type POZ protein B [Caerostris extrusa]
MAVDGCAEGKCFTFTWKLENVSYCWQENKEPLCSPKFVVDSLELTRWSLLLYPRACKDGNYISYYLDRDKDCPSSENDIEIDYALSFMAADGSALRDSKIIKKTMPKGEGQIL